MVTKVEAARIATQAGTTVTIASAKEPNVLVELISGKKIGTRFQLQPYADSQTITSNS
jgi:glutamate 5-kinase